MPRADVRSDDSSNDDGAASRSEPKVKGPHLRNDDRGSNDDAASPHQFLTGPQVCERYSISAMSLWRWLQDPDLNFPKPTMRVRERRYWSLDDLFVWEKSCLPRDAAPDKRKRRRSEAAA